MTYRTCSICGESDWEPFKTGDRCRVCRTFSKPKDKSPSPAEILMACREIGRQHKYTAHDSPKESRRVYLRDVPVRVMEPDDDD